MEIKSKYRGYCRKCHYTIWQNERITWSKQTKAVHLNCIRAIQDKTPRNLDPRYERIVGKVNKKKLRELVSE